MHTANFEFLHFSLRNFTFLPSNFPPSYFSLRISHFEISHFSLRISHFEISHFSLQISLTSEAEILRNSTELILIACQESCLKMLPPSSPAQLHGIQREQLIHYYFLEGYTYRLILCFLLLVHGIPLSLRQLKRVLCKLGLKRRVPRYSVRHLQQVEELIRVGCNYL